MLYLVVLKRKPDYLTFAIEELKALLMLNGIDL